MKRKDFIEKQKAYTLERERRHFDKVIREDKAYARALEDLYKKTAKDIQETLESLYTRYALSEGVPIEEVKKKVSRMEGSHQLTKPSGIAPFRHPERRETSYVR